jgi:hypothetical protein
MDKDRVSVHSRPLANAYHHARPARNKQIASARSGFIRVGTTCTYAEFAICRKGAANRPPPLS